MPSAPEEKLASEGWYHPPAVLQRVRLVSSDPGHSLQSGSPGPGPSPPPAQPWVSPSPRGLGLLTCKVALPLRSLSTGHRPRSPGHIQGPEPSPRLWGSGLVSTHPATSQGCTSRAGPEGMLQARGRQTTLPGAQKVGNRKPERTEPTPSLPGCRLTCEEPLRGQACPVPAQPCTLGAHGPGPRTGGDLVRNTP